MSYVCSCRAEDAAARFYAELLAQHERDRAARAAGEDDEAEDDMIELDVRIPFLVYLPDNSLHVALLDEELTYRASGAVASAQLSTQGEREAHAPTSEPRDAEHASVAVDLPTAFTVPPSGSLTPPQGPEVDAAASETDVTVPAAAAGPSQPAAAAPGGPPTGQNAGAHLRDAPPQLFTSPVSDPPVRPDVATGDRESMSQRLWRLGSAVFSAAGDTPDTDIPTNVIWSIASVPAAFLPAAVLPPVERSSTLRGTLFRSNRSIQQLSGALGLTRAESAGSSRSFFGRSHTDAGDAALDSAYMPMDMHPEEDLSDEYSEEESAAISAYPEGVWPESSPRLRSVSGRFQCDPWHIVPVIRAVCHTLCRSDAPRNLSIVQTMECAHTCGLRCAAVTVVHVREHKTLTARQAMPMRCACGCDMCAINMHHSTPHHSTPSALSAGGQTARAAYRAAAAPRAAWRASARASARRSRSRCRAGTAGRRSPRPPRRRRPSRPHHQRPPRPPAQLPPSSHPRSRRTPSQSSCRSCEGALRKWECMRHMHGGTGTVLAQPAARSRLPWTLQDVGAFRVAVRPPGLAMASTRAAIHPRMPTAHRGGSVCGSVSVIQADQHCKARGSAQRRRCRWGHRWRAHGNLRALASLPAHTAHLRVPGCPGACMRKRGPAAPAYQVVFDHAV